MIRERPSTARWAGEDKGKTKEVFGYLYGGPEQRKREETIDRMEREWKGEGRRDDGT